MPTIITDADRIRLHLKANVLGVGLGFKKVRGVKTKDEAVVCTVRAKLPEHKLKKSDLIPKEVAGVPTDVVVGGKFRALVDPLVISYESIDFGKPARPGNSIGHKDISAGTFGFLAKSQGEWVIHSNNHVLADSNQGKPGDSILYPGPYDLKNGGIPEEQWQNYKVAELLDFLKIKFIGPDEALEYCKVAKTVAAIPNLLAALLKRRTRLVPQRLPEVTTLEEFPGTPFPENFADVAIAKPTDINDVSNEILTIGIPSGFGEAVLDMPVRKHGRTSDYTEGIVSQVEYSMSVSYGEGKNALFVDQFIVEHTKENPLGQPGDSGSCVLNDQVVVGTLFAGSDVMTAMNHIRYSVERFGLTL